MTMACICFWQGLAGIDLSSEKSWSDDELSSAVEGATDDLDGYTYQLDQSGDPLYPEFEEYEDLIGNTVVQYRGDDAPKGDVYAERASYSTDADAQLTVTASGTDAAFCVHVERIRSKKDDYTPPGITGGEGGLTYPGYRLAVTSRGGAC
ncbi:hypothetical protein [Streptomyces sp. WM6386]|uniref:hypothetical protein n=1 Tax=Streptomyces sp. WM6386 TaxID=1415558 RepID=UPI00131E1584|nr:hypothetical protein [Streptomyces sp. WM6386]